MVRRFDSFQLPGLLTLTVDVDDDGCGNDRTLDDLLVVSAHLQEGETGGDYAQDDGADHGAGDAADAARQRGAADDGCRETPMFTSRAIPPDSTFIIRLFALF